MKQISKIAISIFVATFLGCSTSPVVNRFTPGQFKKAYTEQVYKEVVDGSTRHDTQYDGFHNIIEYKTTRLSSDVLDAQVWKKAIAYNWTDSQIKEERARLDLWSHKESRFFMSFYTPNGEHIDLASTGSLWKVYLEVEGKRYHGKVIRYTGTLVEISDLFKYHNRFFEPFNIVFPIASKDIDGKKLTLILAGPVTKSTAQF